VVNAVQDKLRDELLAGKEAQIAAAKKAAGDEADAVARKAAQQAGEQAGEQLTVVIAGLAGP
jgi:hypothetical protein